MSSKVGIQHNTRKTRNTIPLDIGLAVTVAAAPGEELVDELEMTSLNGVPISASAADVTTLFVGDGVTGAAG
ncbi:hypothetical protein LTR05_005429 [Lithohypha guttulata]|uniref:Uncharacterized protein n=1 Tax=Lithohypha guttulata TaxID=1690604 RepID=A0AAN7SZB5_9EURO|nr:hypothetical protein LTR05_005429 [Lithohypha guttulata]